MFCRDAAEARGDLLEPVEGRVEGPGPAGRHVVVGRLRSPRRRRSFSCASAGSLFSPLKNATSFGVPSGLPSALDPVVAVDVDDSVLSSSPISSIGLDHPADLVVGIGERRLQRPRPA